jgi:type II secretory pathway pseudopilin PulG
MKNKIQNFGFTVVEMLLGIALFGILVPAVITGFDSISLLNDSSKDLAIANIIAENKIEELRSIGYNSVPTGTTSITNTLPATLGRTRSGSYTVTNAIAGQKMVDLTITITGRQSTSKTLTYRSIIGELGVGQ